MGMRGEQRGQRLFDELGIHPVAINWKYNRCKQVWQGTKKKRKGPQQKRRVTAE
jgi:hypothetical protein